MRFKVNIDDITIGQLKEMTKLLRLDDSPKKDLLAEFVGQKVLIRDNMAGLFVTTLTAVNGKEWTGGCSRKIYYWAKAGAIEGIAETGIDLNKSKITVSTSTSNGRELVQLCPVSDKIYKELMGATAWNPK